MGEKSELRNAILWSNSDIGFTLRFLQRSVLGGAASRRVKSRAAMLIQTMALQSYVIIFLWTCGDPGWVGCEMCSYLRRSRMKALGIRKAQRQLQCSLRPTSSPYYFEKA